MGPDAVRDGDRVVPAADQHFEHDEPQAALVRCEVEPGQAMGEPALAPGAPPVGASACASRQASAQPWMVLPAQASGCFIDSNTLDPSAGSAGSRAYPRCLSAKRSSMVASSE